MNDQTNPTPEVQNEAEAAKERALVQEKIDEIGREYYGPADQTKAAARVNEIIALCQKAGLPVSFNWDAMSGESLPAGYGIAISPMQQRREDVGNVTIGVYFVGMPDPDLIAQHESGGAWIRETIIARMLNKFNSAARPKADNTGPLSLPFSVVDFITNARQDNGLAYFREAAPAIVKALNTLFKRKIMNPSLLRQVLASAPFASQQFKGIPQDRWVGIINRMINTAKEGGKDPGILAVWLTSRDTTTAPEVSFDLDALEGALTE